MYENGIVKKISNWSYEHFSEVKKMISFLNVFVKNISPGTSSQVKRIPESQFLSYSL